MNRLFILLFIALAALAKPLANERPNFILCMADDQGWGDTGYNGHPLLKTPVMDEMARTGLRFDRFYAAAAVCSPTRGSVMTGRHPNRFGCFAWGHTLRPQEITIAEALKKAGYTTGHFGKWHIGSVRADGTASPGNSGFDEWFSSPNFYENNPLFSHNGKVIETKGESSDVTAGLAMDWIGKVAKGKKPFLAVVWLAIRTARTWPSTSSKKCTVSSRTVWLIFSGRSPQWTPRSEKCAAASANWASPTTQCSGTAATTARCPRAPAAVYALGRAACTRVASGCQ